MLHLSVVSAVGHLCYTCCHCLKLHAVVGNAHELDTVVDQACQPRLISMTVCIHEKGSLF